MRADRVWFLSLTSENQITRMLLLGIDLGTSSIKVSVIHADTQEILAQAAYPETEAVIISTQPGWAEQDPEVWWQYVQQAILKCHATDQYNTSAIGAIGIAYQMHGLVAIDARGEVARNAIIWCDSRAVAIGNKANQALGEDWCREHLLNSPGNFTASKLAWVQQDQPEIFEKIHRIMLPGDFIAFKLTGDITTSSAALSEGVFWDFKQEQVSKELMTYFGFDDSLIPHIVPVFSSHGRLKKEVAAALSLPEGVPVTYKAGDQPNNALSLNVLEPGEVAATAGTSGVIYGVSDQLNSDIHSRINSFAHVNHSAIDKRIGILSCINGTGIFNKWIRNITGQDMSYQELNQLAATIPAGSDGLLALPFGNGAERMLQNQCPGASFEKIDLNLHGRPHLIRAVQEGIAYSFRYGLDIMRENGMSPQVIRASKTNLFQSEIFTQTFADVTGVSVEFYEGDGSVGAALGSGIGIGHYASAKEAVGNRKPVAVVVPSGQEVYTALYQQWIEVLQSKLF